MRKQAQSARGRYVSAEKVQELFAQLGVELCAGRKRIRAARSDKSISIYVNGGQVDNKGIEASLTLNQPLGPIQWNSTFTYTINRNIPPRTGHGKRLLIM